MPKERAGGNVGADDLTALTKLRALLEVTKLVRSESDLTTLLGAIARTIRVSLGFHRDERLPPRVGRLLRRRRRGRSGRARHPAGRDVRMGYLAAGPGPALRAPWCLPPSRGRVRLERSRRALRSRRGGERRPRPVAGGGRALRPLPALRRALARDRERRASRCRAAGRPTTKWTCWWRSPRTPRWPWNRPRRPRRSPGTAGLSSTCWTCPRSWRTSSRSTPSWTRCATRSATPSASTASRWSWRTTTPASSGSEHRRAARSLLIAEFEVGGCYLLPEPEALRRMARPRRSQISTLNGRGPRAWSDHWLFVPLYGDGSLAGRIWVDDPLDRLLPTTQRLQALRLFADQASAALALAARMDELRFLADHDPLTGLLNRRAFIRELEAEIDRSSRYRHSFALMVCDLDGFKELNDREGHPAGDEALHQVATVLSEGTRGSDRVFRIGGDEFALLLPEADREGAPLALRRLSKAFQERVRQRLRGVDASFGIALFPDDGRTTDELFRAADTALYEAKRTGLKLIFAHRPA